MAVVAVICAAIALVVAAVALAVAINNDNSGGGSAAPGVTTPRATDVAVHEVEYAITPSPTTVAAGPAVFHASNDGNAPHELVVIATPLPDDSLPRTPDGKVDLASSQLRVVGQASGITPGGHADVTASLTPGSYVLICNVTGHYAAGMHSRFTAT